jgi:DNA replication licensing factor MCM3
VNFQGNIGRNYVTPRGLKSNLVNQLVQVQGIVTKMTMVRPKIQTSVHYCEATRKGTIKHYTDNLNFAEQRDGRQMNEESNNVFPTKDVNDNPLSAEYGYCVYKDSQTVTIQEMPENAPPGQLPRSVEVVLENDLVDCCKPGDRV